MIEQLKHITPVAIKRLVGRLLPEGAAEARRYVGTNDISGQLQLELLKREGCQPASKVLEIGCGRLHAGIPLMNYLEAGHYCGVDPNAWLRMQTLKQRSVRRLIEQKQARFLSVSDFDASGLDTTFDFVFSHSVLSHCADWQFDQFLRNVSKVLAPNGRILASIRLAEGNAFGSCGTCDREDSRHTEWQYPGVSFFTLATIMKTAKMHGMTAVYKPEYTQFYTQTRPSEYHDWIVFAS